MVQGVYVSNPYFKEIYLFLVFPSQLFFLRSRIHAEVVVRSDYTIPSNTCLLLQDFMNRPKKQICQEAYFPTILHLLYPLNITKVTPFL